MLEFSDLKKFDFEILEYVKDNEPVTEEKIVSHFHSDPGAFGNFQKCLMTGTIPITKGSVFLFLIPLILIRNIVITVMTTACLNLNTLDLFP